MYRTCVECGVERSRVNFTRSQWAKNETESRCKGCINGTEPFACRKCKRTFRDDVDWSCHMSAHFRRTLACSFCGDKAIKLPNNRLYTPYHSMMVCDAQTQSEVFGRIFNYVREQMNVTSFAVELIENGGEQSRSNDDSPVVRPDRVCPTCAHTVQLFRNVVILMSYGEPDGSNNQDDTTKDDTNTPASKMIMPVTQDNDSTTNNIIDYN